jgi:long-subunit fatty acid transport protein
MIDEFDENSLLVTNPNAINIYEDYTIQMPSKITASGAFVFKNFGLISFDYSRKDYGSMKFKPENDNYFSNLNQDINLNLKEINTYRIGAEIISDRFSFRGGYMTQDSPYNSSSSNTTAVAYDNNVDDSINGFSLGIGYKLNQSTIDLSFVKLNKSEYKRLYDTGLTNQVHLNTDNTMLTISISTIF